MGGMGGMGGKRRIGSTAIEVVPIGLGCMGFSHAYGAPTEKSEAIKAIRKAHEAGYDFFDTAECYTGANADGSISYNEEIVGEALRGVRDDGNASLFGDALDWLALSGTIARCSRVNAIESPLEAHADPANFKVYLCDTGLLVSKAGAQSCVAQEQAGNRPPRQGFRKALRRRGRNPFRSPVRSPLPVATRARSGRPRVAGGSRCCFSVSH